jgi:polyisoprenoid-binding protein YceI
MKHYKIDPLHTDIAFKIKHLMISNVTGNFNKFDATMEAQSDSNFEDATIFFEADVDSITTNITDRDNHLRSKDFFDVETYPKITFRSTSVKGTGSDYSVEGNLTIKGVTKPVQLKGTYNGNDEDAYGQTKYGFELEGAVKRSDYGLNFNIMGGKGSYVIGDDVKLMINVQMMPA